VHSSALGLLTIINDILDFSKIEAGKLEIEHIDMKLRETMGDTMKALCLKAHEKDLELILAVDPAVPDRLVGDPVRLRQVITNLIGNAIKFTSHGEVVVKVEVSKSQPNKDKIALWFCVTDTGIGIPEDKLAVIFEAFSQADGSITRRYGGTGLGLTISTRLVEQMEGKLTAESVPGQGSTFHFTATFGINQSLPEPSEEALDVVRFKDRNLLIVDDNTTLRGVLLRDAGHWGMNVTEAGSGEEAINILSQRQKNYDYILLDSQMPDIDGFGVAQFIKTQRYQPPPAIIMMLSSTAQRGIVEKHADLSISIYINKPIGHNELIEALSKSRFSNAAYDLPQAPVSVLTPSASRGAKILLAEDNPVNQRLAIRVLEKFGYTVALAENGLQAVLATEREDFDLILMDVQMPEMGGFEATSKIREREATRGIRTPIIAMTAHAIQGYREKCLRGGMDGYVSKPIHVETLKRTIEEFLAKSCEGTSVTCVQTHSSVEVAATRENVTTVDVHTTTCIEGTNKVVVTTVDVHTDSVPVPIEDCAPETPRKRRWREDTPPNKRRGVFDSPEVGSPVIVETGLVPTIKADAIKTEKKVTIFCPKKEPTDE